MYVCVYGGGGGGAAGRAHFENEKLINLEMRNDRTHISSLVGTSESLYAALILFRYRKK